ncbi:hypothetical protein F2Q70_00019868 [Brassica cretica]|uniref:Uncharacterized protein n=1 Tax=Brassica cretica TaxID=69181 RepID=A0A8S9GUX2_BRACR|nr:hypothetical protein F2Q70_00019868 [Brassica cretica]KAF3608168.1 hypothetical protein DY000_02045208 [Brassica cretica]
MGRRVRILKGEWEKTEHGRWNFAQDPLELGVEIWASDNEAYEDVLGLVREGYNIRDQTPIILTYKLPQWMLFLGGEQSPPQTLLSSGDIEVMMSIREWDGDQIVSVTCDIYHHDGFECCLRVLKELFTEEQMVTVYRLSLEIAKARNTIDPNVPPFEGNEYPFINLSDEDMWVDAYIREENYVDNGEDQLLIPLPLTGNVNQSQMNPHQGGHTSGGFSTEMEPSYNLPNLPPTWGEMEVGQAHWDVLLSQGRGFPVNNYFNLDVNCGDLEIDKGHNAVVVLAFLTDRRGFPINNYFNLDVNRGDLEIDKGHNAVVVLVNEGSFTNSSGGAACVNYVNTVTSCAVTGFLD